MKKLTLQKLSTASLAAVSEHPDQQGFIPMMLCIIGFIALVIVLVYLRVSHINQ